MIEFIEIGLLLAIYLLIFYILGAALAVKLRWTMRRSQCLLIGFFAYFFVFQICAEAMILTQQPLHALKNLWLLVLSLMLIAGCSIIYADRERGGRPKEYIPNPVKGFFVLMILAILCQIATGLLLQRNLGWDFAYYMGNLTTSVSTDTMYVYDGSSGNLLQQLDLRYALSGFYMNTAVLSQLTGINAMMLQRYLMGVLDFILADLILYHFAMKVFLFDKKKSYLLVTVSILLMVCWDVYDTSAQFLFLRNYEAKSYCANVVLPMVVYLIYCIWKDDHRKDIWQQLFVVCSASVAVSMSSILLVPAAVAILMAAHILALLIEDRNKPVKTTTANVRRILLILRNSFLCVLANGVYLVVYFLYTKGILVLEVM